MVKYFYGAGRFTQSTLLLLLAVLSPNQYCLTPSLRFASLRLKQLSLLLCLGSAIAFSSSFRFQATPQLSSLPLVVPTMHYGLEVERFAEVEDVTQEGQASLASVLHDAKVNRVFADRLVRLAANKAFITDLDGRPGARFYGSNGDVVRIAQAINEHEYVLFDLEAGEVFVRDLDGVTAEYEMAALFYNGSIDSMLAYTSFDAELTDRVARGLTKELPLAEAFEVGIVRIIYPVKRDERGRILGYGDVQAVRYQLDGQDKTAIRFDEQDLEVAGFFTPEGAPAQRTWLTTPVPGARISSPFNLRRRHPVLKRIKPHYGTDYAAPYGTPILAVSDGTVIARSRTRGNGKFVKIKHDAVHQTQYLHMKAFAKGIKPGVEVKKGQVIGYVGSTGLSSGPHVCFRFWKNGKQVDHRAENLATAAELTDEAMTAFEEKHATLSAMFEPQA